ncbi:hypothetical protein QLQ12_17535 [Actinoplanes sp. NEAU-A12]|uniref:Uncharacterized protein n=1 Tax=Actinoplanes sandaracinus TaxID=3045177 RepID=A0ABT6WL28_9ACTN|nr:hypothetical protein [Actinoplanes sandaracinus]MDI6100413.1 hypothetical protein [Actinoplanes sandaracinus]
MPTRRNARKIPPREVPGYAEAWAAGLIPRVPATPPRLAVAPTARAVFRTLLGTAVGGILTLILFLKILEWVTGSDVAVTVAVSLGGTLLFVLILRLVTRIGDQLVAELRHGYTTLEVPSGTFWVGEGYTSISGDVVSRWDYRGLWLLDGSTGAVLRGPVPGGDPPGMYPSPHRPGRWELWTGLEWLGHYDRK